MIEILVSWFDKWIWLGAFLGETLFLIVLFVFRKYFP